MTFFVKIFFWNPLLQLHVKLHESFLLRMVWHMLCNHRKCLLTCSKPELVILFILSTFYLLCRRSGGVAALPPSTIVTLELPFLVNGSDSLNLNCTYWLTLYQYCTHTSTCKSNLFGNISYIYIYIYDLEIDVGMEFYGGLVRKFF